MTKTLVAAPEPERPCNEPVTWSTNTTTAPSTTVWIKLDVKR